MRRGMTSRRKKSSDTPPSELSHLNALPRNLHLAVRKFKHGAMKLLEIGRRVAPAMRSGVYLRSVVRWPKL
jgi:hypothetical protein